MASKGSEILKVYTGDPEKIPFQQIAGIASQRKERCNEWLLELAILADHLEHKSFDGPVTIDNVIEQQTGDFYVSRVNGKTRLHYCSGDGLDDAIDIYIGFMNKGEANRSEPYHAYMEEVDPHIEDATGLRLNDGVSVFDYTSGKKCIYDATSGILDRIGLKSELYVLDKVIRDDKGRSLRDAAEVIYRLLTLPISRIKMIVEVERLSKNILGLYDIINISQPMGSPLRKSGMIGIVTPNIVRHSTEIGSDLEDLTKYVITHERIHDTGLHNFPEIDDKLFSHAHNIIHAEIIRRRGGIQEISKGDALLIKKESDDAVEAVMTVIEGHAEFHTNRVVKEILPGFEFRRERSIYRRLAESLGLDKNRRRALNRYNFGSKFMSRLYDVGGAELTNMPFVDFPVSTYEIRNPDAYLERIGEL